VTEYLFTIYQTSWIWIPINQMAFWFEYKWIIAISEKLSLNYSLILIGYHNFLVNIIFYHIFLQIYLSNFTQ
jgi:hypothetical protein